VMATHGHTGVQRLWIGSVATKVVRSADRPVLLVRAQEMTASAAARRTDIFERTATRSEG
jgi:hypothetical protein